MESSTWQLSCSRLAGSLWGGIAPEQPAQPHYTATELTTKFRESFFGDGPAQVGASNMLKSLLVSFPEYCKNFCLISLTAPPTTYMAPPSQ